MRARVDRVFNVSMYSLIKIKVRDAVPITEPTNQTWLAINGWHTSIRLFRRLTRPIPIAEIKAS